MWSRSWCEDLDRDADRRSTLEVRWTPVDARSDEKPNGR